MCTFLINRKLFDILGSCTFLLYLCSILWHAANSGTFPALSKFLDIYFIPSDFSCFIQTKKRLWHPTSYHSKWCTCVAFSYIGVKIIHTNMVDVSNVDGVHAISYNFYRWLVFFRNLRLLIYKNVPLSFQVSEN